MDGALGVTVVVMTGLLLTVIAWQVLAIARDGAARDGGGGATEDALSEVRQRLDALEKRTQADHES